MKLYSVLDKINSLEKNSFLKIIDNIISNNPKNITEIEEILSESNNNLKSVDNINISKVFDLITDEFSDLIKAEFLNTTSQLDILIDIISKDGNSLMRYDWFAKLYDVELKKIQEKTLGLEAKLNLEDKNIDSNKLRDYTIYKKCVNTAYFNDNVNNRDAKITFDELSILITLSNAIELSQEEVKLINYSIIPPVKLAVENIINDLKNIGVVFYSKKNGIVYVADEVVRVLRDIRKKEIADKYYRRILKVLRDPQVNLICKKYGIDRSLNINDKINQIINDGISISSLLTDTLHKENDNLTNKKKFVNELWDKLLIGEQLKGVTLEDKITNILAYFNDLEKDEKIGMSIDGYSNLLSDLSETLPNLNQIVKDTFELQDEFVLNNDFLLEYNIKPRDVLDLLDLSSLIEFCSQKSISNRGDKIFNILDSYKDSENLYIENFDNIGYRNLHELKENGITIKESELGLKFEDVTRAIFSKLGFNVDEDLKNSLNSKRDKIDILINLGNNDIILIECKTVKESAYNKFTAVSRQLKSYKDIVESNGYNVIKSLLIAPEFSDDFVNDTELEYDLNLSLLTSSSLLKILNGFKKVKKHKQLPYKLLLRDVVIQADRIIKAIER